MVGAAWNEGRYKPGQHGASGSIQHVGKKGKLWDNSKLGSEPHTHLCANQSADLGKCLCQVLLSRQLLSQGKFFFIALADWQPSL